MDAIGRKLGGRYPIRSPAQGEASDAIALI